MPTRPGEWRISIHVFGINGSTCIEKHLNGFFSAEGRSAMRGRFRLRSAITHEAARLTRWLGNTIGICMVAEEHFDHEVVGKPIGCA